MVEAWLPRIKDAFIVDLEQTMCRANQVSSKHASYLPQILNRHTSDSHAFQNTEL